MSPPPPTMVIGPGGEPLLLPAMGPPMSSPTHAPCAAGAPARTATSAKLTQNLMICFDMLLPPSKLELITKPSYHALLPDVTLIGSLGSVPRGIHIHATAPCQNGQEGK